MKIFFCLKPIFVVIILGLNGLTVLAQSGNNILTYEEYLENILNNHI